MSGLGFFECISGHFNLTEGLVGEEIPVGILVFGVPVGGSEVLVVVRNIIELIGESVHGSVVEVNSGWGLFNVVLEDSADILPLLDELLASWGSQESLIKSSKVIGSSGLRPFFESKLKFLGGWGVLDSLSDSLDIHGLFLDSLLTPWFNLDLESGHGVIVFGSGNSAEEGSSELHLFFKFNCDY
jgi:hypothetical protein